MDASGNRNMFFDQILKTLAHLSLEKEPADLCDKPDHVAGMLFIGIQHL